MEPQFPEQVVFQLQPTDKKQHMYNPYTWELEDVSAWVYKVYLKNEYNQE